jgi:hypothetical protein
MTIRMISTRTHLYAGRRLRAGEQFDARGKRDMRLLEALGRARRVHADVIPVARPEPLIVAEPVAVVAEPVMTEPEDAELTDAGDAAEGATEDAPEQAGTEPEPETEISPRTGRPKRQYRRRDMTAED